MNHLRRLITAFFLTVLSLILLLSAFFAYLIVTPLGGKMLVRYFKQQFVAVGLMHVGHYEGTLQNGFVLKDVIIKGLSYLPDAILRVQEIHVRLPLWDLPHSDFRIFNARISIPDSDPIVFTGEVYAGQVKGDLYAKSVDVHAAIRFWVSEDIRKNLQGFISNVDFKIQGPWDSPQVNGSFLADDIRYQSILLTNVLSKANVTLMPSMTQFQIKGIVTVDSGLVNVRKVNLQLAQSKFIFKDDVFNPTIDIQMGAKLEDMDFHLKLKGAAGAPVLTISSDPPMPPQDALRILFTGNAWSPSTSPFNGVTSSQLAENFLDYSLQDMNEDQQIGLKTKLTDNLKLGAEMDQMPSSPGETNVYYSRKVDGEMDVSDHMSLNISKSFLPQDSGPSYQDAQQPVSETQVYVQYKKRF
jgi:hypothetical protein